MPQRSGRLDELSTLVTEEADAQLAELDTFDVARLVQVMTEAEAKVPAAVRAASPQIVAAVSAVAERVSRGGRLVYVGAGTPGRLGVLDAAECPPTFSTPPGLVHAIIAGGPRAVLAAVEDAEDDEAAAVAAIEDALIGPADAVVGISASGRTPFVLAAVERARALGACTVGLSCNPSARLSLVAEFPVEVVIGPEVIAGSTRLTAASAQKQVLNMFSTIAMVRHGKTYGNLMVDLRATNAKLRARARTLVARIAGVSPAVADEALNGADLHVATAVVMLVKGADRDEARAILDRAGSLRAALGR